MGEPNKKKALQFLLRDQLEQNQGIQSNQIQNESRQQNLNKSHSHINLSVHNQSSQLQNGYQNYQNLIQHDILDNTMTSGHKSQFNQKASNQVNISLRSKSSSKQLLAKEFMPYSVERDQLGYLLGQRPKESILPQIQVPKEIRNSFEVMHYNNNFRHNEKIKEKLLNKINKRKQKEVTKNWMSIDSPRKENEKCLINISNDFETAREPLARDLNESKTQIKSQLENLMKKKLSLHNNNQNAAEKKNNEYFAENSSEQINSKSGTVFNQKKSLTQIQQIQGALNQSQSQYLNNSGQNLQDFSRFILNQQKIEIYKESGTFSRITNNPIQKKIKNLPKISEFKKMYSTDLAPGIYDPKYEIIEKRILKNNKFEDYVSRDPDFLIKKSDLQITKLSEQNQIERQNKIDKQLQTQKEELIYKKKMEKQDNVGYQFNKMIKEIERQVERDLRDEKPLKELKTIKNLNIKAFDEKFAIDFERQFKEKLQEARNTVNNIKKGCRLK